MGADCADADLGSTVPQTAMADNTGTGDDVVPSCAGGGEDFAFQFTAPEADRYTFDTLGSPFDTSIVLLDGCEGTELACNDDMGPGDFSAVDADLAQGQSVIVYVDSFSGQVGPITLNVTRGNWLDFCYPLAPNSSACAGSLDGSQTVGGTLSCDPAGIAPLSDVYELEVQMGDCVHATADNIDPVGGPTGAVSGDIIVGIVDPAGLYIAFDDEMPCTDPSFGGGACPDGSVTMTAAGTAFVSTAQWGGAGCPDGAPYALDVSINGVAVDLGSAMSFDDLVCP
jgi:hypothetical protein